MIKFDNVVKQYGKQNVLNHCTFSIAEQESVGLMGLSGSGKSTIAKLLLGLEKINSGTIVVNDKPYHYSNKQNEINIQIVFQDSYKSVNPHFTVYDILLESVHNDTLKYDDIIHILSEIGLDETYLTLKSGQLSGGQLQRVCIARALLQNPNVIIFDESLSGLDPIIQGQILKLLQQLKEKYQFTYIFITHEYEICYAICDRILVLNKGKIVEEVTDFSNDFISKTDISKELIGQ